MNTTSLAVLILTGNEEKNIEKCLASIAPLGAQVYIVDSMSTDRTVEIASSLGATVYQRRWTTYADQLNWGLDNCVIETEWVMRMDADEELTPGLVVALRSFLHSPPADITGIYVRRQVHFMGRWIRHGGYYPTWLLRVFRNGRGRCEALAMDEHIVVDSGQTIRIHEDIIDKNNKDLTFWTDKHNRYASREVQDILDKQSSLDDPRGVRVKASLAGQQDATRRWVKDRLYLRMPLFVRPFLYFCYRYFLRLGFLDGKQGLIFHFLQGFWYRFLVDAKIYERRIRGSDENP
jgi:glycosyltransferase involved in cell wall biosynthesis